MEVKTTLYNHMKEQIDSIRDENIRLSEKLHVRVVPSILMFAFLCIYLDGNQSK